MVEWPVQFPGKDLDAADGRTYGHSSTTVNAASRAASTSSASFSAPALIANTSATPSGSPLPAVKMTEASSPWPPSCTGFQRPP